MRTWRNWQTRWFQVPVKQFMWVQVPSSAPCENTPGFRGYFCVVWVTGLEIGGKLHSNLSVGPNSLNGCLSAKAATGGSPVVRTNKKGTFGRQKFLFCLSIAKAMAYHHALACISSPQAYIINRRLYRFRNDDIQHFVLMIYRNKLRMIYKVTP